MRRVALILSLSGLVILLAACATRSPPYGHEAAVPHPMYKVGKPYKIDGVWYYPAEDLTYDETGIASWYGQDFNGKYTANGEVFDINGLTAAHRTLPMPSIVEITNLETGRSLELRVNDRGPYVRGRIIDVSRRAAQLLGFEGAGTAKVRVRILAPESIQAKLLAERASGQLDVESAPAIPLAPVAAQKLPIPAGVQDAKDDLPPPVQDTPRPAPEPPANYAPPPLSGRVTTVAVRPTNIYIQAGAFARAENANRLKAKLAKLGPVRVSDTAVGGINLFRVRLGPVASVEAADRLLELVVGNGAPDARIVVD